MQSIESELEVDVVTSEAMFVEVRTVDFKGKPPFKRKVKRLEQTDAMLVEITSDAESSEKRSQKSTGNSIFKRH